MHLRLPQPDESLTVILKLAGETCNINCHYCYEKRKPYPNATVMRPELLAAFLSLCGKRPLSVSLHGGEPLIVGRQRMRGILAALREHAGPVALNIQTNATLLDDDWLDFFADEWPDIEMGVSLDGDFEANAHRVDYTGENVYPLIVEALARLERRGRPAGIVLVVNRRALGRAAEIVDHLRELPAVRVVKLTPCLDYDVTSKRYRGASGEAIASLNPPSTGRPGWATTPHEYAEFTIEAFDRWRASGAFRHFLLEPATAIMRALAGLPTAFTQWSDVKEPYIVTLYPDGRIGSSDEVGMPRSLLGHVSELSSLDEVLGFQTSRGLAADMQRLLDKCGACVYESVCRGGALADRLRYVDTPFDDAYCESRARLIEHVFSASPALPRDLVGAVGSDRTGASKQRGRTNMRKDVDFESFAEAVRSLDREESESQAMYHASRVNTADWQRVEDEIAKRDSSRHVADPVAD